MDGRCRTRGARRVADGGASELRVGAPVGTRWRSRRGHLAGFGRAPQHARVSRVGRVVALRGRHADRFAVKHEDPRARGPARHGGAHPSCGGLGAPLSTLRPPRVVWCPWDRVRDRGVRSRRWTARRCPCHGPRDLRGRNRAAVPRRICASTMNMTVSACLLVCVHDTARRPDARAPVVLLTLTGLPPRQRWRCVFV